MPVLAPFSVLAASVVTVTASALFLRPWNTTMPDTLCMQVISSGKACELLLSAGILLEPLSADGQTPDRQPAVADEE